MRKREEKGEMVKMKGGERGRERKNRKGNRKENKKMGKERREKTESVGVCACVRVSFSCGLFPV